MKNAEVIVWDWNGTLVDDAWLACDVINEIRIDSKLEPISTDFFREIYQHPIINMYSAMGFETDPETFAALSHRWGDRYVARFSETSLHEGARELLIALEQAQKKQFVLSAHNHTQLLKDVNFHGIDQHFHKVVGINNRMADSKLQNGRDLLDSISVDPRSVLFIGDSTHDFEVASELGCHCLLVSQGAEATHRLMRHGAPVVAGLKELYSFLF
jgi:phosphoglycolate phosphatase